MQSIDRSLVERAKSGEEAAMAALIAHMMPALRKGAALSAAPGLDFEDAVQEGLIGLFSAVKGYDESQGISFERYAAACIRNAQQDARRMALRKKHAPLNFSVPLPEEDVATAPGPEEQAIEEERCADVMRRMRTVLSPFEHSVLDLTLDGASSAEIAQTLGCTAKAVSNALTRARRKLRSGTT